LKEIQPQQGAFGALVEVPGSKSISNRALILAALSHGQTNLENLQFSDDSRLMLQCLRELGFQVDASEASKSASVVGQSGRIPNSRAQLFVGNAGTAARFLPCLAALGRGSYAFDGEARMRERPMGEILGLLAQQGSPSSADAYPFVLSAHGLKGGQASVDLTRSTQFASGLMMAAPYAQEPLSIEATGARAKVPYVAMTAAMMEQFGVRVEREGNAWKVPLGLYQSPGTYLIEPDVSGAAYFYAACALVGGKVAVKGLSPNSMQGDIRLLEVMKNHWGCKFFMDEPGLVMVREPGQALKGLDIDMNAFSDQALTLAALAPFCEGPTNIRNVGHIRKQECDRIRAISKNLATLGIRTEERQDGITIFPGRPQGGLIETFGDHRVAMAFSLVGLKVPGVAIDNEACVAKTFEDYWKVFEDFQAHHV
jgi:3-phosphoshikimate 1-carboxyvinyltransferase